MEDEFDLMASNKKVEPITFGSCISISLENHNKCFISMENFISTKLNIKKFDSASLSANFNFSIFRILPFSNFANFKNQDELHDLLQNFTEKAAMLSEKELKERKDTIRDLKTNLDSEIHSNTLIYNKLKGTPVLFGSSLFQLVHVATMKYLSLNDTDKDNLSFELIDFPNSKSFFKFLPCLKLQKQRNNFVYDKDLVVISSTKMILNRNPCLFTNYADQSTDPADVPESKKTGKVSANIEETKHWKLHLYQHETDDDPEKNCIRVGDAIWLNLSETNHILTTSLQTDPFEHQHIFDGGAHSHRSSTHKQVHSIGSESHLSSPGRGQELYDEKIGTLQNAPEEDGDGRINPFFESEILSRLVLEFKESEAQGSTKSSAGGMAAGGLWMFESPHVFEGGPLEWERPYRLKHVNTERYLRVHRVSAKKFYVELSSVVDDNLLFHLVPIKNLLRNEEEKKNVAKDAYFRLQHMVTKQWISFRDDSIIHDKEARKKEGQSFKVPSLSAQPRELDTFKMVKADFQELWEISFLLSAIPTFIDLIDFMKPLENKTLTPAELHHLKNFEEVADKAIDCIDSLEAFCNNRLPASLAMNQEFFHISPIRQRILKEQYILGLLCWLLSRGFPTNEELEKIDWQLIEKSLKKNLTIDDISPTIKQLPIETNTRAKKQDLLKAEYIRKKYSLCLRIYELNKVMCTQNSSNQDYTFKFLSFYVNHLGHGTFVSELLLEVIRNNEKILYGLHQVPIAGKMLTTSLTGELGPQGLKAMTPEGRTFFKQVVNKFKEFEPFEKKEFMELLKIGCLYQEQAIYINQDKVFRLIYEDPSFKDTYLVNLVLEDDELFINLKDEKFAFGSFFSKENLRKYQTEIEFLKDQLDLYAVLCMNRNYNCAGTFRKIFQVDVLITYITNDEIPDDIKASLVKLISTIHIDKEPRTVQEKPNLVRVLEIDLDEIQRHIRGKHLFNLPSLSTPAFNTFKKEKSIPKPDKKKVYIELGGKSPLSDKDHSPLMSQLEPRDTREEEIADEQLEDLKRFILRYLKDKSLLCTAKMPGNIYTSLTTEVVKITGQMLKFGMFNTKLIKQSQKTQFLAGSTHGLVRTVSGDFDGKTKYKRESEFERLICYLTPLLEFDEEYFKAMNQLGVKRKQAEKEQGENNVLTAMLNGATGIGKSIFAFKQIFQLGNEVVDKRAKKANADDNEAEIIRDQIFKKPQSLKKVLNKFSNKTYTIKEEDDDGNYEVDIKIGICGVFEYIFNMREDFVIDNLVNFFKGPFLQKVYEDTSKDMEKFDILESVKTLLPDASLEVGSYYDEEKSKFKNYTKYEELRSFDAVLERPFIESLLMGFFFTSSAPLQNALVRLLQRCCSAKANLRDHIEKLELLVSEEDKALHAKLKKKLNALKNLTSNAQIWLQIIERSLYQPNYFDVMEACYKKLLQIQAIFKPENATEDESLMIRQRIFRYLGGHKTLFEVLQKGFIVFESYLEVFRQADTSDLTLKYRIDVADKIVLLFRLLHSLLSRFCTKNPRYQHLLFQSFNRIMLVNKLNLGQIELMVEIFRDNYDLARSVSEAKLKNFCDLIVQHGQKEIFLQVFDILLTHPDQDTLDIQKKVLLVLLNDNYADHINPFGEPKKNFKVFRNTFQPDKDPFFYKSKLLEIIAKCLKGKANVTLISKVFKFVQIKDLIDLLYKVTEKEQELLSQIMNPEIENYIKYIEAAKTAATEILIIFFSKFSQSFDELTECTKTLFSYFDLETKRITIGNLSQKYLGFVLEKLIELILISVGNYLKDSGTANINLEFGHESYQVEASAKRCALKFAKRVLSDFEDYTRKIEVNEIQVRGLARLANLLRLPMPSILREYLDNLEQERSVEDEEYVEESTTKKSSRNQKNGDSFSRRSQKYQSVSASAYQDMKRASSTIAAKERSIAKKLTISDLLQTQSSPAGQVSLLWRTFKDKMLGSDYMKKAIKEDVNVLSNSIMNFWATFVEVEDKEIKDFFITTEDLLVKFFEYLEYWIQKKAKKENVIFLIKALGRIIKNVSDKEEEMVERQEMFDRLNATKIMLVLIWEEQQDDTQYLYSIFNFMIHLLSGGNSTVQKTIYDFFNSHSGSERFFRKMNDLILREITQVDFSSKYSVSKEISQLGMKLLRLLQLFCEGHNNDLQNYLRHQVNSKNNYDLVTLTTKLLSSYRVNSKNFESVMQCFDTLTELVQGPCQANQVTIVNSKFLEFAVSLLNEEEKAIDYFHSGGGGGDFLSNKSGRSGRYSRTNRSSKQDMTSKGSFSTPGSNMRGSFKGSFTANGSHLGSGSVHRSSSLVMKRKRKMKLNVDQLSKVKYKCLVTLVSLLECSNSGSNISSRIIRAIPVSVLTNNLVQVYQQYKRIYKDGEYSINAFGHHQDDYEPEKPEHAGFVIENGFNIYILINLFVDNSARENYEDEELNELLDNSKQEKLLGAFKQGFIGEFTKFWRSLFSNFVGIMDMVKKNVIDKAIKSGMVNEEEAKLLKQELEKKQLISEAMSFFGSNMAHIEIVRNNKLQKIYFPILPFCKFLSEDSKEEFQDTVNRASTKTKLLDLMERSDYLIRNMKHEEKMEQFFNHYKIFGLITNHVKLWEYSSFILGVILNIFILISYSTEFGDGDDDPHLLFDPDINNTAEAINLLGVLNLIFSSLVVSHFFLKRAPILIEDIWIGFFEQPFHLIKTPLIFIYKVTVSFMRGLKDFDIMYNCLEIMFSILGLAVHPFFFFFMLMDIARIGILRNVFKAVWEPKMPLLLTMLVFCLAQWYFTLIGYTFFNDNYDTGLTCESLFQCYLTTIDETFKQTGAVGAYLVDPATAEYEEEDGEEVLKPLAGYIRWGRFFFDNIFKIVIVLIIVNMIAGIIIDKFGALKDDLEEKTQDMTGQCFVCGIEREKLDKSSDIKNGYESHIKRDHYMWNYLFYKAYLQFKTSTEYDGNESYIASKINKFDISWFPINRALVIKDEENEVNEKIDKVSRITKYVADIRAKLKGNMTRMNRLAENLENH